MKDSKAFKKVCIVMASLIIFSAICLCAFVTCVNAAEPIYRASDNPIATGSKGLLNVVGQLTDGDEHSSIIDTRGISHLVIDVISDKGMTITIYRLPKYDDPTVIGAAYSSITVDDGGSSEYAWIQDVGCPRVKVVYTKTESGDSTTFFMSIRGMVN